jgi:hypothetical protein
MVLSSCMATVVILLDKWVLAKRNWHGSVTCCFCHKDETINHLFLKLKCQFAHTNWLIIQAASNLNLPHSVYNMFGS